MATNQPTNPVARKNGRIFPKLRGSENDKLSIYFDFFSLVFRSAESVFPLCWKILEVNGKLVDGVAHNQLLGFLQNLLRKSTRLKLTVQCNFKGIIVFVL